MVDCISQQSWVLKSDCENCWPNSSYYITEITSKKSTKVSCYIYIVKSLYTTGLISSFRLYIKRFISFLLMSFDKWEVSARFIKAFFAAHTRYQSIRNIWIVSEFFSPHKTNLPFNFIIEFLRPREFLSKSLFDQKSLLFITDSSKFSLT